MVKICFKIADYDQCLKAYSRLLEYVPEPSITRNYSEKSINNLLDHISTPSADLAFLERFYEVTLDALKQHQNERLWIKTHLKLAKLLLDRGEFQRLNKILRFLKDMCEQETASGQTASSDDMQRKGTQLLEVYALEIQMHTQMRNNKKLKQVYQQCLNVKSAIPHPRIMGIVRECGGKMHMMQKDWAQAQQDFFDAFKNYDEAGSPQRIQCLKYLVLANMLTESEINPFDSQETKPYKAHPELVAMTDLVAAFQRKEIIEFQKILAKNKAAILGDGFIKNYVEDVLRSIRTQVILQIISPYRTITLDSLAQSLGGGITVAEVEELLVELILDEKVRGRIDALSQTLVLENALACAEQQSMEKRYRVLNEWCTNMGGAIQGIVGKLA